ncbi:hypothetical protein HYV91_03465 [Candidatus Wolfebacteria bacterium]|nr:hypothetical protein [Candidatus Wolfebacteria bacterium]
MKGILDQLGVNWRLLLTQGVNFFILLAVLTFLAYRPLIRIMEERRKKIELGLKAGEEGEKRLKHIEELKAEKLAQAERSSLSLISRAEEKAKKEAGVIVKNSEAKAKTILEEAVDLAQRKKMEELENLTAEAKNIIKSAIVKTVQLDPRLIDEALISRAVETIKKERV